MESPAREVQTEDQLQGVRDFFAANSQSHVEKIALIEQCKDALHTVRNLYHAEQRAREIRAADLQKCSSELRALYRQYLGMNQAHVGSSGEPKPLEPEFQTVRTQFDELDSRYNAERGDNRTRLAELRALDDKSAHAEHLYREALAQWDDFQAVAREVQATCRATSSWNRELADVFARHILQVRLILQTTDACKQQLREQDQALQERTRQLQSQAESIARLKAQHVDLEHRFQTESIAALKAQHADLEHRIRTLVRDRPWDKLKAQHADLEHRFRTLVRDGPWAKEEEDDNEAQLGDRAN